MVSQQDLDEKFDRVREHQLSDREKVIKTNFLVQLKGRQDDSPRDNLPKIKKKNLTYTNLTFGRPIRANYPWANSPVTI